MDKPELPDSTPLDADVATLRAAAGEWAATPLAGKRRLLEAVRAATAAAADEWVRVCCQGKGIATGSPAAGEEWTSGPYAVLSGVAALIRLLKGLEAGADRWPGWGPGPCPAGRWRCASSPRSPRTGWCRATARRCGCVPG